MTFTDEARTESTRRAAVPCGVGALISSLPDADSDDVAAALDDQSITGEAIARVIERRFHVKIQGQTVQRHRNSRCQCV